MWPLDGRTAFRLGPQPADLFPENADGVFFEPEGNRVVHLRRTMRVHGAASPSPLWGTVTPQGTPPPEAGLVGYERDSSRALLVTRAQSHAGPVRVFSLRTTPGAEAWSELATVGAPATLSAESRAAYDSTGRRLVVVDFVSNPPAVWTLSVDARAWTVHAPTIGGLSPGARSGMAVAWDEAGHRLFAQHDQWLWQLALEPSPAWSSPAPTDYYRRYQAAIAYDPVGGRLFLNGGGLGDRLTPNPIRNRQLWALPLGPGPLARWHQIAPPGIPSTYIGAAAVADSASRRWFIHGGGPPTGTLGPGMTDSLWVASFDDPDGWQLLSATGAPNKPRRGHVAVLDPLRRQLWLHGGTTGDPALSLRRLHLEPVPLWEDVTATGTGPAHQSNHAAAFDAARDRILFFVRGPGTQPELDVWALGLGTNPPAWSLLPTQGGPPHLDEGYTANLDRWSDRVLLCGGSRGRLPSISRVTVDSTWALDLAASPPAWTRLPDLPGHPDDVARLLHTAVIDEARRRLIVAFGGRRRSGSFFQYWLTQTDVWALDLNPGGTWSTLPSGSVFPRPRREGLAMFDRTRDRMLLAGGVSLNNETSPDKVDESGHADDVWALQFESLVDVGPPLRRYDPGPRLLSANPARRGQGWSVSFIQARGQASRLEVLDVRGRIVWSRELASASAVEDVSRTVQVDGPGLRAAGIYFVRLLGVPGAGSVRLVRIAG